jgi:hypothetical protein
MILRTSPTIMLALTLLATLPTFASVSTGTVVVDENGRRLPSVFGNVKSNKRIAAKDILAPHSPRGCAASRSSSAKTSSPTRWSPSKHADPTVWERVVSWFSPPVVHAQACPTCTPPDDCTGSYMYNEGSNCYQGCNPTEIYPFYISDPARAEAIDGYCIGNSTYCNGCVTCGEQHCMNG